MTSLDGHTSRDGRIHRDGGVYSMSPISYLDAFDSFSEFWMQIADVYPHAVYSVIVILDHRVLIFHLLHAPEKSRTSRQDEQLYHR